ncbi:hypothetical protein [Natronobeatus ordinarius]|uniref:hypothetical protein n=1 Tax=Natronobeatus ordinarius TaxID=2963433 RepID=UPI0020CC7018|nr:hypothetical protein [Natronobeatus ordinarius]
MTSINGGASRTASIIQTICDAEGLDVTFRFKGPISVPTEKYDGRSYQSDTLPKATINATIQRAEVEHLEGLLMCHAAIKMDELERTGINPSVVYTEPLDGNPERCVVGVRASREWIEESDITMEEAERAIEEGRQEEVLPPWDGRPTVVVDVERTEEGLKRSYNSNFHIQYDPPTHEIGELIDVRVK